MTRMGGVAATLLATAAAAASSTAIMLGPVQADPAPTLSFSAVGDFGETTNTNRVLTAVRARGDDLTLALGDLSYGATGQEGAWCDRVTSQVGAGYAFELLAGNHESGGLNGNINDFSACLPNQLPGLVGTYGRQYYVDVPKGAPLVRYVMISPGLPYPDGTWSYAAGTARYQWTSAAIDGARAAGIPWVVVGMHKPCTSMGRYPCEAGIDIENLLVSKRVDLVLTGHEHLYQRSRQLAHGASCAALAAGTYLAGCVADSDDALTKGAGTVMTTVGTGGVGLRDVYPADPEAPYFAAFSGLNQSPAFGSLAVTLTPDRLSARFNPVGGATFTDAFTIDRAAANQPPTARLAAPSCADLACAFDGSASTDPDGVIATHSWSFGDGSGGSGATASHTYAAAGDYLVTLTVTDNSGASSSTSATVTVTAPPAGSIAQDSFGRAAASGWGVADQGGPWTVSSTAATSVDGVAGKGKIRQSAGSGVTAYLNGVNAASTDLVVTLSVDKLPVGGSGLYANVIGRRVGTGEYRAKLRILPSGATSLALVRTAGSVETVIQAEAAVPGTMTPGAEVSVRLQATGAGPTTVRARAWLPAAGIEPTTWLRSVSDSTAALQGSGPVGLYTYLSSSTTNGPLVVSVDNLVVKP